MSALTKEKALIFRIVHRRNVPWILCNGMHCKSSHAQDPDYQVIGNAELIQKRTTRCVPIGPGGMLSDYIPFYFTPCSPMLYNIRTGYGVNAVRNDDIIIFITSLHKLKSCGVGYVFSDRHAYLRMANFYDRLEDLDHIDWQLLQSRNFRRDPNDPERIERYQAEALVHGHLPIDALLGIACHTNSVNNEMTALVEGKGLELNVCTREGWYFK